jgi:hypothetical protein
MALQSRSISLLRLLSACISLRSLSGPITKLVQVSELTQSEVTKALKSSLDALSAIGTAEELRQSKAQLVGGRSSAHQAQCANQVAAG